MRLNPWIQKLLLVTVRHDVGERLVYSKGMGLMNNQAPRVQVEPLLTYLPPQTQWTSYGILVMNIRNTK